jgi:hypothetical protein
MRMVAEAEQTASRIPLIETDLHKSGSGPY